MLTARIIKIIDLLKNSKEESYKNIAKSLDLSERIVRYEIDRINDLFNDNNLPLIKKEPKGILVFPEGVEVNNLLEENYYIYSQEERIALMKLIILFNSKKFKLNKFSEVFVVSRATIKNDLSMLEEQLSSCNIKIRYEKNFFVIGNKNDIFKVMSSELSKYINLFNDDCKEINAFEKFAFEAITTAYNSISIGNLIKWINRLLEKLNYILTDQSYKWYISNILVLIWHIANGKEYPEDMVEKDNTINDSRLKIIDKYIDELNDDEIKGIIRNNINTVSSMLKYTNKYNSNIQYNYNLNYIEMQVIKLISLMSQEMDLPFENDSLLYEGLINHIGPLIDRINKNICIDDDTISLLKEKDIQVYEITKKVIKEMNIFRNLKNDDEIVKVSLYFMASIYRVKNYKIKNVLLVCGLGYGTSYMLKENLMTQYEIEVIDIIPMYKLKSYSDWNNIDMIISTTSIKNINGIPFLEVNPILKNEDYKKIESLGIRRRKILFNYNSISAKLDFLSEKDKLEVIDVIKKETGYESFIKKNRISKLTDILEYKNIRIVDKISSWRKAVILASSILEDRYFIDEDYKFNIISSIERLGFYSIMDNNIALLHGSSTESVIKTSMSLIVTKEQVSFEGKNANIIFCLASKDKKEHVPAIISLMRIIKNTDFIKNIRVLEKEKEVYEEIIKCQTEVIK